MTRSMAILFLYGLVEGFADISMINVCSTPVLEDLKGMYEVLNEDNLPNGPNHLIK